MVPSILAELSGFSGRSRLSPAFSPTVSQGNPGMDLFQASFHHLLCIIENPFSRLPFDCRRYLAEYNGPCLILEMV